jgi:hypothetical protein
MELARVQPFRPRPVHHGLDLGLLLLLVRVSKANITQILQCLGRAVGEILVAAHRGDFVQFLHFLQVGEVFP